MIAEVIPTTSLLCGLANTTASFLVSAIVIKSPIKVAEALPAIIKLTSTDSLSWNSSNAVFLTPSVAVPSTPPVKVNAIGAVTSVKVLPAFASPQLVPFELW